MAVSKAQEVERIVDAIYRAILEQRLKAGTRLVETRLVDVMQANRNHVRAAINVLRLRKVVTVEPNRGAFVAKPEQEEAREIIEARRMIENSMMVRVGAKYTARHLRRLEKVLQQERKAEATGSRHGLIKYSGEFHLELARITKNRRLVEMLQNLIAESSLIAGLYENTGDFTLTIDQHQGIYEALKQGDLARLPVLMDQHLASVEQRLLRHKVPERELDLADILG